MAETKRPFFRYDWTGDRIKIIKLHGSIDLIEDPNIIMRGDLEENPYRFECISKILWRAHTAEDVLVRTNEFILPRSLPPSERYSKAPVIIMPPYYSLGYGYQIIQYNWRKAETALERAKRSI